MSAGAGKQRVVLYSAAALTYALLYAPIAYVLIHSLGGATHDAAWVGLSIDGYRGLLRDESVLSSLGLSVRVAVINASLAVILGTLAALALAGLRRGSARAVFRALLLMPFALPEVLMGLALWALFMALERWLGWSGGRGATVIAIGHATVAVAYAAALLRARLAQVHGDLARAARDLGATPAQAFLQVTLPLLAPALGAAWVLAFLLSFGDFVLASLLAEPATPTLPMVVFSAMTSGASERLAALAVLMVLTVAVGLVLTAWLLRRTPRVR